MTSADETRCGAPMVGRRSRAQAHRYRLRRRHFRIGVATGFPPGIVLRPEDRLDLRHADDLQHTAVVTDEVPKLIIEERLNESTQFACDFSHTVEEELRYWAELDTNQPLDMYAEMFETNGDELMCCHTSASRDEFTRSKEREIVDTCYAGTDDPSMADSNYAEMAETNADYKQFACDFPRIVEEELRYGAELNTNQPLDGYAEMAETKGDQLMCYHTSTTRHEISRPSEHEAVDTCYAGTEDPSMTDSIDDLSPSTSATPSTRPSPCR
ncbi:unnamed protein product [Prorocentrum cordatum]|uniref:Uncharacterized protein n=1 Tax=Prorocentrum cordatum TaxID=2364126 RepID=A0ABN9RQI3_9DINO|nr:unnamed protein product [Polarella glacialis]